MAISRRVAFSRRNTKASLKTKIMKILRVLGFGFLIVMLKFLIPEIFMGLQNTLLVFFSTIQAVLVTARSNMTAGLVMPK